MSIPYTGRWITFLIVYSFSSLAFADWASGWMGQRLSGDYTWGWIIAEQKAFLTYNDAEAWTRANYPGTLVIYGETLVDGKRHVLLSPPSQYNPRILTPSDPEPRYCEHWSVGTQGSAIAERSGHIMYGPDGTFPAWTVALNNCIQPDGGWWRIRSAPVVAVYEAMVELPPCPVAPLTPYSPDPYPLNTDKLTARMKKSLSCLANMGFSVANGNLDISSAYRAPEYQLHLQELWDKWDALYQNKSIECKALKTEIQNHFTWHELIKKKKARPHSNSAHTRGEALDMNSSLGREALDKVAGTCGLERRSPDGDPPHYTHR